MSGQIELAAITGAHAMSDGPELTFERVFASPSLNGPAPRQAKLSPDGRYLTLLRNRADELERYDLWGFDLESREWSMLVDSKALGTGRELSEDEKMQRERARVGNLKGIISYQWSSDGTGVLVPLDGDLYLAKLDGEVTRLTDTEESELNPKLSSMLDFRVHGASSSPRDASAYPAGVLVRDVAALIDHLALDDYDLAGFSLGARTALHAVSTQVLSPRKLVVAGMGVSGLAEWQKRSAFFKRVIDEFDTIERGDPAYYSRQFLKSQGVDRVAARLLLDAM